MISRHCLAKKAFAATATALFVSVLAGMGPAQGAGAVSPGAPAAGEPVPQTQLVQRQQQQRQPSGPEAPASAGGSGRYALLREEGKDSGCLVNLMQSGRAQLGPGCRDQGLVVFDPVGWSTGRNMIILRARKGHRVNFVYNADGTWHRDPPDQRPLSLRKY